MNQQQLTTCLQFPGQTSTEAWILGSLPSNFYAISCDYTQEMVESVGDTDLSSAVKACVDHLRLLEKNTVVFDNGQGFHRHTLEFTDRIVKILVNEYNIAVEDIYFTVGMVAHADNVMAYEQICQRLQLTRLKLIFLSGSQGLLNQELSQKQDLAQALLEPQVMTNRDKIFTAMGHEQIHSTMPDFDALCVTMDRPLWDNFDSPTDCLEIYGRAHVALICEDLVNGNTTNYGELDSHRFSMKTYGAMAYRQPFILIGRPGSLTLLHDMGFKTFSPYIDETYDSLSNDTARLYTVFDQCRRLKEFTESQWQDFHQSVEHVIEHNFNKLKSMPNTVIFEHEVDRFYKSL